MDQDWIHLEHARAWTDLTNKLAVVDDTGEFYETEDLVEELKEPGIDPQKDTLGLWERETMVGYGQLRLGAQLRDGRGRVSIGGGISPECRGRGYGSAIMDALEIRAAEKMAERHPGIGYTIDVWGNAPGHSAGALAMARGYEPARYFQDMSVDPAGFIPRARPGSAPEGLAVVRYSPGIAESVRLLDNESFADHWGSTPKSVEEWEDMTAARSFRNAYSRILQEKGADGEPDRPLAYVLCSEWLPGELYIARVGTARSARGRGYAAWLLSMVISAAFDAGFSKAELTVDAQSPTGATGLYERLGFTLVRQGVMYRKSFPARRGAGRPSAQQRHQQ